VSPAQAARPHRNTHVHGEFDLAEAGQLKELAMLWTIAVILVILWALGFLAFHVAGGLIHLLLVVAAVVIVYQLVTGRRAV
jgi:hypothetical protein